jgi:hypothetical protein
MKFNEVIINENKLGDWMFGNKADRGKSVGGTGGPTVKQPTIGIGGGLTRQDRLAYKLFVQDFISDILSTIDSGVKSGLINPPLGAPTGNTDPKAEPQGAELDSNVNYDEPAYKRQGKDIQYENMNNILESIIENTDVEQAGGREFHVFIRDWLGQWMQNVDYTKSKDVLYNIINNLEQSYNNSKNPQKPNIDRTILQQLADGAWAATSTVGVTPAGAKNAPGAEVIQKSIQAQGAKQPELKSKEPQIQKPVPAGIAIKDAGGKETYYNGKQWVNSTGTALPAGDQQKFSKMYAMDPKPFYKKAPETPGGADQAAAPVKESKTQSAIRAEKIPSLQTR